MVAFLCSCTGPASTYEEGKYTIDLDGRLPKVGDFYYLTLDRNRYQTIHRLEGKLIPLSDNKAKYPQRVIWESSLFWWFEPGDTAVTIVRRNVNDSGFWVNVDTLHFVTPDSMMVPTVNGASYTDDDGNFSGVIAPTLDMVGDTMTLRVVWTSRWYESDTVHSALTKIILQ